MKTFVLKFSAALAIVLVAGLSLAAQTGRLDSIARQASLVTEFDVAGLKVLVKRRESAPTVAGGLFIRGGARNLTDKNAGIENLTLSAATEAGTRFPKSVLRRELARTGSAITSSTNRDYSAISFISTRDNFNRIWELFTDVAINPTFLPDDVTRVRSQILTGLRESESTPDGALSALQDRIIYRGHPYANDVSGTVETIGALTPADLRAFHKEMLQTSRLLLVIVGNVDPEQLKTRIAATFGKLPRGNYSEASVPALDFTRGTLDIVQRQIPTNYVQGVFAAPSLSNPDYYAMRVATNILRERVFEEVRVRRNLSYAPSAELNAYAANTAFIYVSAVDANQAVRLMLREIRQLGEEGLSEEMLDGMTGQFLTTYYLGQETNAAQAGELARYELIGGGWRNSFEFLNRIREVSPADVRRVVNKYMKNIRFVVVGDPRAIDRNTFLTNAGR